MSAKRPSDTEQIESLLRGDLPPAETERLATHLADDSRVSRVAEGLPDDTLMSDVRKAGTSTDPDTERLAERLTERLKPAASVTMTALPSTDSPILLGDDDEPIPAALEYFKIDRVLGQGGMGTVYLADDTRLGRKVAVKTLKGTVARKPGAKERFLREARLAAALEHEAVVPIYYVGEAGGIPFLAMPLLKGHGLDDYLAARGGRLPVAEALRVGAQVANGLAAAHAAGLIHRDIKPSNIWVDAGTGRVRILDFGLARTAGDDMQLTASGMIVGTPAYMPPEQARGRGVDSRADLFSLGVVLYQMLTGRRPFIGTDTVAILSSLALDTPTAPALLNPEVPPAVSALVMKLLEKDPVNRPQSAAEVATALAPPVAVVPKPWRQAEQTEFDFSGPTDEKDKPTKAVPTKPAAADGKSGRKIPPTGWIALGVLLLAGAGAAVYQFAFGTKDGTLVVEVDADADVRFKNGKLEVYDDAGKKLYTLEPSEKNKTLPPGKYRVKVVGADGVKLDTETFELERKGRAWVKVTAAPPTVAVADPKKPPVPGAASEAGLRVDQQAGGPLAVAAEVPNLKVPGDGPFTVEGWVKIDRPAHGENPHFFGWTYQFVVGSNGLGVGASQFADDGKGGWTQHPIRAQDPLERGKWQHLAAVRDGKQNRLYINGALAAKGDVAGPIRTARTDPPEGIFVIGHVCDGVAFRQVRVSKAARYSGDKAFTPATRFEPDRETVALYRCDEGQGDKLTDSSGNGLHGTLVNGKWGKAPAVIAPGGPVVLPPSVPGAPLALRFAEATETSGVEVPTLNIPGKGPFTMEGYVTLQDKQGFVTKRVLFGRNYQLAVFADTNETVTFTVWSGEKGRYEHAVADKLPNPTKRYHVACVRTETEQLLFIDGKLLAKTKTLEGSTGGFDIGRKVVADFSEIRVSRVARYKDDFVPAARFTPDKDTVALYHCDDGQGDKLTDSSGNNHHGKIVGGTWVKAAAAVPPAGPGVPLALRKPTWPPGPADNILPGLVSRPAILDGVGRWQIVPTIRHVGWNEFAFSPDNKWVATCDDTALRLFDARTGALTNLFLINGGMPLGQSWPVVEWSHDSRWLKWGTRRPTGVVDGITFAATDATVPVAKYETSSSGDFGWNPKFNLVASLRHSNHGVIEIVDPTQAKPVEIDTKVGEKGKAVWSPNGETLLVVREDKTAQLFGRDGKAGVKLAGEVDPTLTPTWSADGQHIAALASATEVGFWNKDGTAGKKTGRHEKPILALHWHPDGKLLAVSDAEGKRHFWKTDGTSDGVTDPKDAAPGFAWAKGGKGFFTPGKFWPAVGNPSFTATNPPGFWAAVSPDQKSVALAKRGEIAVADLSDGAPRDIGWKVLQTRDGAPSWSADGQRLAITDQNGVSLYDARDPKKVVRLGGGVWANGLNLAAFSPKGNRLAVANDIGHLFVCEPTGKVLRTLSGPPGLGATVLDAIYGVAWHPDGKLLAATNGSATVTVYDVETGKVEATTNLPGLRPGGYAVFSPENSDHLLITHPDQSALWRWKVEKEPQQKFPGLGKLLPSPDGKRLISFNTGGGWAGRTFVQPTVVSPDLKDRTEIPGTDFAIRGNYPGSDLAWHPDGKHIVVTRLGEARCIQIRSLDGKVVEEIKPDGIDVSALEWVEPVAKRNVLVGRITQGSDTYLFDVGTKKLTTFGKVSGELAVSPDGRHLIAMEGSTLTYWNLETKAVEQKVVLLPGGEFVTLSVAGEVLEKSANADNFYRYLVEDKTGKLLLKTPAEMAPSLPQSTGSAPLDPAWLTAVVAMPPEKQVEAVHAELKLRNPEFVVTSEHNRHGVEGNAVVGLDLDGKLTDLTPVRALTGLKKLHVRHIVNSNAARFPLVDLSPLTGLSLTHLDVIAAEVTDLTPLKGMPLVSLNLYLCENVSDLSPLAGLPLERLVLRETPVADLTPIKGLKLKQLDLSATMVPDLKAVAGMPLESLETNRLITDLSPLQGMKLKLLHVEKRVVSDLSPLKGMPLEEFWGIGPKVTDLSPLEGMPLKAIDKYEVNLERDGKVLRAIKSLETINGKPAKDVLDGK